MPTLNWLTRDDDIPSASKAPYRLLEEVPDWSAGQLYTSNMLIQGDNLEALKSLLPFYAGQVKCVFIDPPYNTRKDFPHYDDNLEHSQWLAMMYPRLELLRDLLAEDGSIWAIIDDDEGHYLKVIMDEIFGRRNFVASVVWQKKYSPQNDTKWLSDSHDYILVYARDKETWRPYPLPRTEEMNKRYKNPDNDPRGLWKPSGLDVKTYSAQYDYPIETPSGRIVRPPAGRCWVLPKARLHEMIADNRITFGKSGNNVPAIKRFLSDVKQGVTSMTTWLYTEVGHNQDAKKEVKAFNARDVFTTPKPERLIQRVLQLATRPGDLVLDSFLGSGTTAAVAHKMGRCWIGIEMGEHAVTHCLPRLNAVIEGEQGGISQTTGWRGGGGFRFYRLGPPVFDENGGICLDVRFPVLAAHVWFSETGYAWNGNTRSAFLGLHDGRAYALLYNGVLGDKRPNGGNVLTRATLSLLREEIARAHPDFDGPMTVYGEQSLLWDTTLARERVTFKQTPYEIKARR